MADDHEPAAESRSDRRLHLAMLAVMLIIVFSLIEVIGWVDGGGLSSIAHARSAMLARADAIDIDDAALRHVMIVGLSAIWSVACVLFRVDAFKVSARWVLMLGAIGGGFILDIAYDEAIMSHYAAAHGYRRCPSGDHDVGHGKGRISFDHYVLARLPCPPPHPRDAGA